MILAIRHLILLSGPDCETCKQHIRLFFEKSQLVQYDSIEFDDPGCLNGAAPEFAGLLEQGLKENGKRLNKLLAKLQGEGCSSLEDLPKLEQGFKSKLLHTMSHLLDGFFGIDSYFYDLDEISHRLTTNREKQIKQAPEECWLIMVTGKSVYGQGFENKEE